MSYFGAGLMYDGFSQQQAIAFVAGAEKVG